MPATDEELMHRFQKGDRTAFADLVERYRQPAVHFSLRMLHDRDQAEDMAQEAFARILLRSGGWTGRARFTTYLFTILKNLCIDELRWRSRWGHSPDYQSLEAPDTGSSPEAQVVTAEERRLVRTALEQLSPDHKAALLLREFHGLSYEEVAGVMGWTDSKTKITIYRARLALGRVLQAKEGGAADAAR